MSMTGLTASTFIWFREGLEAYLIVQMAWLMTNDSKQRVVLLGSTALALVSAMVLGYFALDFINNDFAQVEAWTAIAASALLFWTAWFCHGAAQHMKDIKDQMTGSMIALATIVFLTVFREGAEIVAFLSGLWVAGTSISDIGTGALVGLGALAIICYVFSNRIKMIPIGRIFRASRWVFTALALYFLYYGIHELLE
jgi:high-affinity iron transporter